MLPLNLKAENFAGYPPEAKQLVTAHIKMLQQLPLSFLPNLLREVIDYDFKFPAERSAIGEEFTKLSSLSPMQISDWFQGFSQLSLDLKLQQLDWVNQPDQFAEQESAYLWTTHQLDAFRKAATDYGDRLQSTKVITPLSTRRLGIAVIGQGVASYDAPLFRKLRQHGTYFEKIKPENGLDLLLARVGARAKANPIPYGHWYIDGGQNAYHDQSLTSVSYQSLEPMRTALLKNIETEIGRPGMGPEELRTHLARLSPTELGLGEEGDTVLNRFQLRLFTEGSGTQIFSTTFAQWATREALRRAQPLTLLTRFAPRQRQKPMNELLSSAPRAADLDFIGSLIDGEMAAYYHWVNQQRLQGSEQSAFVLWFEGHNQAMAISPSFPRGTTSNSAINLGELISLAVT